MRGPDRGAGARVPQPVLDLHQSPQAPDGVFIRYCVLRPAQVLDMLRYA